MNKANIVQKTAIAFSLLICLSGCSGHSGRLDLENADVVVVEANLQHGPSYLVSYDKSGNKRNSVSLDCIGLNSNWSTNASIVGSIAYFNTSCTKSAAEQVVAFDLNTGEFQVFDRINPWLLSVTGNEQYIFGMNTIAGKNGFGATIGRYNLQTNERDQIDLEYPGRCIACDQNNLYVVCEPKTKEKTQDSASKLVIVDINTKETEKVIQLPGCGEVTSCLMSDGLIYIPPINTVAGNYVEQDKNTKVFVVNPQSEEVGVIDTGIVAPHYIQEYNDNIVILNDPGNGAGFENQPHEHHITMVNKATHEVVLDRQLDYTPATMQVKGNELYVTDTRTFTNRTDDQHMYVYSLPDFELKRSFKITPEHGNDFYLTTGFCTIQEKD